MVVIVHQSDSRNVEEDQRDVRSTRGMRLAFEMFVAVCFMRT